MTDYNILASYITEQYINKISGIDIPDRAVGIDPAKYVMVGTLAEDRIEQSFSDGYVENTTNIFESVPSICIGFDVDKDSEGSFYIIPQGFLFYTVPLNYEEAVEYILQKASAADGVSYTEIEQLDKAHPFETFSLPVVYKKIDIEKYMGDGFRVYISSINGESIHFENDIAEKLNVLCDDIFDEIRIMSETRASYADLRSEESFRKIISGKENPVYPHWDIDINLSVIEEENKYHIQLQMVNKTPASNIQNPGFLPRVFNAGIRVIGDELLKFEEIKLEYLKSGFKHREPVYSVAENTSSKYLAENNEICTENVPIYYQYRTKTKGLLTSYVTFDKLIEEPVSNLEIILDKMKKDLAACENEFYGYRDLSESARTKYHEALFDYQQEVARFAQGIEQIKYKDYVQKAFVLMNRTFKIKLNGDQRTIVGWRLFQIVFIVSLIGEVIRSEYKDDETLRNTDQNVANLLYFPTGGGKTEAFLGITVFTMFFDRIRGKNDGITSLLKYPLRLLAVQQLERILTIIIKANTVKNQIEELKDTNDFSLGFYVGKNNTPNSITATEALSARGRKGNAGNIIDSDTDTLNEYYRFIDTCPNCGQKNINMYMNKERWALEHRCENPECSINVLPLYIVDDEIYRYLPTIIVSTIDKMAMAGISNKFRMLFGQVQAYCPVHGFTNSSACMCRDRCSNRMMPISRLKDPVPTLFIQDELHLVKESLGTFDSHYESFIKYYSEYLVPEEQRKKIRFIGATATISMYQHQINELYHMSGRRFPCEYPSMKGGEDFYSYTDKNDITRMIMGYTPYGGRSVIDGVWQSVYVMRVIVYGLMSNLDYAHSQLAERGFIGNKEELAEALYDYWITLVYNNRKDDVLNLNNAFNNQANNFLEEQNIPRFITGQMTSDTDFQQVRRTLFDINANRKNLESINLLLATSTISHGVDEDSFNIMYFFGVPNNNAEYIQAYSRIGRKYTGICIDIIRLLRIRDRSYLKNFVLFHRNKDDLVETVPINRWAKNAVYSTFPGILAAILLQYYEIQCKTPFARAYAVRKLINEGGINPLEVADHLVNCYECNYGEKTSLLYKRVIEQETEAILNGIAQGAITTDDFLSDAIQRFSHGRKRPMISLRDTEEQIEISLG